VLGRSSSEQEQLRNLGHLSFALDFEFDVIVDEVIHVFTVVCFEDQFTLLYNIPYDHNKFLVRMTPCDNICEMVEPKIHEFIPKHLISTRGKIQDNLVKEWEVKILAKYQKVADFTSLDAKLNYLDYVQEWTFYGATFFTVEQRQFKDYPSPLTLGINCEGVLLMHPEKKTVLENYHFTDIVTWGHSDEKFIVVVGNIVQQRKLIFKTNDGKHMNHLIHDYVKFKVKSKA
jgi:hypothetical protein